MRSMPLSPSLPDTRQVTITNHSVVVDGRDISDMATGLQLTMSGMALPVLELEAVPDAILYSGPAVIPKVPLDGIERLRQRLGR